VAPSARDWSVLEGTIAGDLVLPDSPGYELARKPAIANFHHLRPQAVARCGSARDVAEVISFATRFGVPVVPRSGGHCFAGRSSTDGVVIDVTPMRSVSVEDGVATVGAGARLGEIYDALAGRGLTLPAGCGPDVGIGGLTLGGGFGILGRKYGLTSDQLLAAEVVLADGRVVECDERREEDLFWALRGAGGGRFGVVTSLMFRTIREPEATAFHLIWPLTEAVAIIDAWQAWGPAAPDELAASLLVTASADADRPPCVHLFGAMMGGEADAARLLDELVARAGTDPASASRTTLPYREAKRHLAEHGPGEDRPGHTFSKSEYFRRNLPTEAVAVLVENLAAGRIAGESRVLDFSPWGGAYNRGRVRGHGVRAPRRQLPAQARGPRRPRGPGRGAESGATLARSLLGLRPSLGQRRHLPEFPRPRDRRLVTGLSRRGNRSPPARQGALRPRRSIPLSSRLCLALERAPVHAERSVHVPACGVRVRADRMRDTHQLGGSFLLGRGQTAQRCPSPSGGSVTSCVMDTSRAAATVAPVTAATDEPQTAGELIRFWRTHRRLSQLDLALEANVSTKHLSFVETGRSRPSRQLLVHLAQHLDLPMAERNRLLLAGGFAPAYLELPYDGELMRPLRESLRRVLDAHQPNPALVVDGLWNLIEANPAASLLWDGVDPALLRLPVNMLRLAVHPDGLPSISSMTPACSIPLIQQLKRKSRDDADEALGELIDEIESYLPSEPPVGTAAGQPMASLELRSPLGNVKLFTIIATLGAPLEVTAANLAIETFLSADSESAALLQELAEMPDRAPPVPA